MATLIPWLLRCHTDKLLNQRRGAREINGAVHNHDSLERQCAPLPDALQYTYKAVQLECLVCSAKPFAIDGSRVCPNLHSNDLA